MERNRIRKIIEVAAVYCPVEDETMRVDYYSHEDNCFWATGEETGEQYKVDYDSVDEGAMFYKLVLIDL